jgi:hypothetical protein
LTRGEKLTIGWSTTVGRLRKDMRELRETNLRGSGLREKVVSAVEWRVTELMAQGVLEL